MFDSIGFQELILIGLVGLLVVGPKELPLLMRKAGHWMNKMRGMAADFRATFDEMARQAELDELRKEVEALRDSNPLKDIKDELSKPFAGVLFIHHRHAECGFEAVCSHAQFRFREGRLPGVVLPFAESG